MKDIKDRFLGYLVIKYSLINFTFSFISLMSDSIFPLEACKLKIEVTTQTKKGSAIAVNIISGVIFFIRKSFAITLLSSRLKNRHRSSD